MTFGHDTTTDEVLAGIDLTGKRAIVTGGSTGLGEETARALASRGAAVTLAVRDAAKGEAAAGRIRASTGNKNIDVGIVELSVPDSVRAFAKTWLANTKKLNLLINNAGIMACPLARTREGWEMQFATNHLGHFLLTCLLVPALRAGDNARVVNLSSAGHHMSNVDFDDPHFERRDYEKWASYGQSKTANILFSVELNKRLAKDGITANAVHPGAIGPDVDHSNPARRARSISFEPFRSVLLTSRLIASASTKSFSRSITSVRKKCSSLTSARSSGYFFSNAT